MRVRPTPSDRPGSVRRTVRRAAAASLSMLLASLAAIGCAPEPDPVLQPVHRLAALLDRPGKSRAVAPASCEIADELRPAIGCAPPVVLAQVVLPRPADGQLKVDVPIPPRLRGARLLLRPRVRGSRGEAQRTAPIVVGRRVPQAELTVAVPAEVVGDELNVQVLAYAFPPPQQSVATRPVAIGRDAVLSVGLALQPLGGIPGGAPVVFRLLARSGEGAEREVLRETLDPTRDRGWVGRRVGLGDVAGPDVVFRFETHAAEAPGGARDTASVPLWGAPLVLEPAPRAGHRNLILISLDTLRGDHLEGSLAGQPLMPELRRIAARGAVFERAYSTYPSTSAAHMSMFTGVYPSTHRVLFASHVLDAAIPTLPELLAAHGYATAAVTENGMLAAPAGFVRGFDEYREFKGRSMWDAAGQIEQTFGAGLEWLERHRAERFFLFLHTYEVHVPYEPPPEYDVFKTWLRDGREVPIDASTPRAVADRHRYAGEVRYTDAMVARLFARIEELGLLDETIVVVTSDHGDEFGEHGLLGHAKTTYDEVLHVPWIVVAPGLVPGGERVATPVSLVDMTPTLLDLARVPAPAGLQGESLVPLLRDEPFPARRVLYAETPGWAGGAPRRVSARAAGFKWIVPDAPSAPVEVYDLSADPGEQTRLDDPALVEIGRALVAHYPQERAPDEGTAGEAAGEADEAEDAQAPAQTPEARPELDERTLEKLKHLGYIE